MHADSQLLGPSLASQHAGAWLALPHACSMQPAAFPGPAARPTWKRARSMAAQASSCSRSRMSPSATFAYTRKTFVASLGSRRMADATWNMGVMPLPPATMPAPRH